MPELCCCEYYDIDGERNHLLACCCNCAQLDEYCERSITCRPASRQLKSSLLRTLADRMRIPWYGGAKQVAIGMPVIYVPALLLLATLNFVTTIIAAMITLLILWIASKSAMMLPKFFITWVVVSLVLIIGVFEVCVVPWLLILPQENVLAIALIVVAVLCVHRMHVEVQRLQESISSDKTAYYCQFCQIYKTGSTVHKYWIDTCVTAGTYKLYLLATATTASCMLYVANLNLTTICHPFRPFPKFSLLLPDDCGEAYESFSIALPFVTAVYAAAFGALLLFELVVNILGYTQCLGICKVLRLLLSSARLRLCCLRRQASSTKASPKNFV